MVDVASTGFFTPANNAEAIARQRKLAELLQTQSMQQDDPAKMAGGLVVPQGPLSGLNKLAAALSGAYISKEADAHQKELEASKSQGLARVLQAGNEKTLDPNFIGPPTAGQQAGGGSNGMLAQLLQESQNNPDLAPLAEQIMMKQMAGPQSGGATGVLVEKYMQATGASFPEALQAVQTGFRQNMLYQDGKLAPITGAPEAKGDLKYGETMGGNRADLAIKPQIARETSVQSAIGDAEGKTQGAIAKRELQAPQVQEYLDMAEKLLPQATSGGLESAGKAVSEFVGHPTKGGEADTQLNVIGAALTAGVPRMEGPQSNYDVQLYQQAAGDLANTSKPYEVRLSAIKTMRELQHKYANGNTEPETLDDLLNSTSPTQPAANTSGWSVKRIQ